jgi:hypothetical protein
MLNFACYFPSPEHNGPEKIERVKYPLASRGEPEKMLKSAVKLYGWVRAVQVAHKQ